MSYALPEFLAHAIAMEQEAADRYLELADMMEAHRNDPVSQVFRDMCRYSEMHRDSIVERAKGVALPKLNSWQYRWRTPPEVGGEEAFDYMLEAYNALKYARGNEVRSFKYYRIAEEEREHVRALDKWLAQTQRPSVTFADDPETLEPV